MVSLLLFSLLLRRIIGVDANELSAMTCASLMAVIEPRDAADSGVGISEDTDERPTAATEVDLADPPELSEVRMGGETKGDGFRGAGDSAGDAWSGEPMYLDKPGV